MSPDVRALTGWGRTAPTVAEILPLEDEQLKDLVERPNRHGLIARGLGRSYGDSAQNAGGTVIDAVPDSGITALDLERGVVTARAGTSLDELMRSLLQFGWFVPVTPGTRFVTVGGAIASDIHGKNHHHAGTFAASVDSIELVTSAGQRLSLSPEDTPEEFWATVGGMGLTGIIVSATFRLQHVESAQMVVDTDRALDLDKCMELLTEADDTAPYSVAWIDCLARGRHLGRSIVNRGRHARLVELPARDRARALGFDPVERITAPPAPSGLLNPLSIRAFNEFWFRKAPRHRTGDLQSIASFFHPLDAVRSWNRLYGARGFIQHQSVVPFGAEDTLRTIIELLASRHAASFLAVLKRFGPGNPAPMSFPMAGWTLALDLPAVGDLNGILDPIDELVLEAGGRLYLAKDARARPEIVHQMYPRLPEWRRTQQRLDPRGLMRSDLNRRLQLTERPDATAEPRPA